MKELKFPHVGDILLTFFPDKEYNGPNVNWQSVPPVKIAYFSLVIHTDEVNNFITMVKGSKLSDLKNIDLELGLILPVIEHLNDNRVIKNNSDFKKLGLREITLFDFRTMVSIPYSREWLYAPDRSPDLPWVGSLGNNELKKMDALLAKIDELIIYDKERVRLIEFLDEESGRAIHELSKTLMKLRMINKERE